MNKGYFALIAAGCVFLSVAQLILPKGKMNKCVTCLLSACFALIVISPFAKGGDLFSSNIFDYEAEPVGNYDVVTSIDDYLAEEYAETYKKSLLQSDIVAESVKVEFCRAKLQKIRVYLSNLVIIDDDGSINSNVIADYVADVLSVDSDKVEIYV